jgi:hypothetical protein
MDDVQTSRQSDTEGGEPAQGWNTPAPLDGGETLLEPALDTESAPSMAPHGEMGSAAPASATAPAHYWQAQGLAAILSQEYEAARLSGDTDTMRRRYYVLAKYYNRSINILRYALGHRQESLVQAALHNLIALHAPLHHMRHAAPHIVPAPVTLARQVRDRMNEDLIVQILSESGESLDVAAITKQLNALDLVANAKPAGVRRHLDGMIASGYVIAQDRHFSRTTRPYATINLDQAALLTLIGSDALDLWQQNGFHGLFDISARRAGFRDFLASLTGFSETTAALLAAVCDELSSASELNLSPWNHADLIGSAYPRPYQYEAYAIFRGYGYQGQVIEAPTGSGKTMIGMMCIQDWLRRLSLGQSILVLVPTVNYQQQWLGELSYKPIGLQLSPDAIFTGSPAALEATRAEQGISPCVIVTTYTALSQISSGLGKGGFDRDDVEIFLQSNNIQYVILDEVHKVVEDVGSVSADVTRLMVEWLKDGSLRGLIGFSGTAAAYRPRFAELGLQLAYVMPSAELIAYGFVAPFAELGVPFAYSDREQRIRDLLDGYKSLIRDYLALLGSSTLRALFGRIPISERVELGREVLHVYAGRKDQDEALRRRFAAWESGGELVLPELPLVTMVQLANGWSDEALARTVGADMASFDLLLARLSAIREQIKGMIYLADTVRRLSVSDFGRFLDAEGVRALPARFPSLAGRAEHVKDGLAPTVVGLYDGLSDWYLRVGEGRVDGIKATIAAEQATRPVSGVIVFDAGKRIKWESGLAVPGYGGVAGVFSQMLGDPRFTPMAALSSEIYLPWDAEASLPRCIESFIKTEIMQGELLDSLFGLATQGAGLSADQKLALRAGLQAILAAYVSRRARIRAKRPGEFNRMVLKPLRQTVQTAGLPTVARERILARLSVQHYHITKWMATFFDYAVIAQGFHTARAAELQQVSGAHQKFFVVKMASGDRKQLMYDLTSRIVDAEGLPINMIIVSPWARTGWNVIKPNVLVDATATRDVTAWQQLRGRAMRAMRTWTNDCYRLTLLLLGSRSLGLDESKALPEDVSAAFAEFQESAGSEPVLSQPFREVLLAAHQAAGGDEEIAGKVKSGSIAGLSPADRQTLTIELMLARNKVTHIYELVKAYGTTSQVRYDRRARLWLRTDLIAAKHSAEYSVNHLTGEYGSGPGHAPLVYSDDPRRNLPSQLEAQIAASLAGCDRRIVRGWLGALATGEGDEMSQE